MPGAIIVLVVVGKQRVVVRISERAGQQQKAFVEASLDASSVQAGVDVDEVAMSVNQSCNDNNGQQTIDHHP